MQSSLASPPPVAFSVIARLIQITYCNFMGLMSLSLDMRGVAHLANSLVFA